MILRSFASVIGLSSRKCATTGILCVFALTTPGLSHDIYVNPAAGDDRNNGLGEVLDNAGGPVKTIARAIHLAEPGDTIHLAPAVYRESALFSNRSGAEGMPIVLDGHGATLEGSDLLVPEDWTEVSPGLYRNDHLIKMQDFILTRWFFLFDGKMNHMGRTSKGIKAPLKKPEELKNDEWTWAESERAFYIRIDPAKKLADGHIAAPIRSVGVGFGGVCEHIVVRNLTGTHVYNDAFNIHGVTRDVVFENIRAIECGDDGFSAHDDCVVRIDGFTSIGNSTGICNIGNSVSDNNRVLIKDCLAYDLFFLDTGRHTVTNSLVVSSSQNGVVVAGRGADARCTMKLDNVLIRRVGGAERVMDGKNGLLEIDHATLLGVGVRIDTSGDIRSSIVTGEPPPLIVVAPSAAWQAQNNVYNVKAIHFGNAIYGEKSFADYQHAAGDSGSRWKAMSEAEATSEKQAGADVTRLPKTP